MKRGFTLLEMLVVIGIIVVLTALIIGGYSGVTRAAQKTRCKELVANAATALTLLHDSEGAWPQRLVKNGARDGKLDADNALMLIRGSGDNTIAYFSLNYETKSGTRKLIGHDRFGIVTPWATVMLKQQGSHAKLSTGVPGGGTVDDHILHFAIDTDGDGIVNASVGGESVNVRATAIVWCCGRDGTLKPYSTGVKEDDVHSWTVNQTKAVQ